MILIIIVVILCDYIVILVEQDNLPRMFEIPVRRDHVFEDSHRAIMTLKNKEHMKARLWVKFAGETGLDYGGLARYGVGVVKQPPP